MLLTMEVDRVLARTARENFARAGVADRTSVIVGDAQRMIAKVAGLVALLRPGGLLVTDNTLWDGEVVPGFVASPRRNPGDTRAIADYNERLNAHPQLMTATIPLRDGVAISVKKL
jgi:predicted O-methyltransferase YrrM